MTGVGMLDDSGDDGDDIVMGDCGDNSVDVLHTITLTKLRQ